jgi:hypothetical protein
MFPFFSRLMCIFLLSIFSAAISLAMHFEIPEKEMEIRCLHYGSSIINQLPYTLNLPENKKIQLRKEAKILFKMYPDQEFYRKIEIIDHSKGEYKEFAVKNPWFK